jgi:hypothetical protein
MISDNLKIMHYPLTEMKNQSTQIIQNISTRLNLRKQFGVQKPIK